MITPSSPSRIRNPKLTLPVLALLALTIFLSSNRAQEVRLIVSSMNGDRLTSKPPVHFAQAQRTNRAGFRIDDTVTHQTMAGFGASFLEAGLICLNSLPTAQQEEVLRSLFDP